jgi:hypothetical protein
MEIAMRTNITSPSGVIPPVFHGLSQKLDISGWKWGYTRYLGRLYATYLLRVPNAKTLKEIPISIEYRMQREGMFHVRYLVISAPNPSQFSNDWDQEIAKIPQRQTLFSMCGNFPASINSRRIQLPPTDWITPAENLVPIFNELASFAAAAHDIRPLDGKLLAERMKGPRTFDSMKDYETRPSHTLLRIGILLSGFVLFMFLLLIVLKSLNPH